MILGHHNVYILAGPPAPAPPPSWHLLGFWGDVASVVGLAVGVVGFIITIYNVQRSRKAATEAEVAAKSALAAAMTLDIVGDLSAAMTMLEEIKTLHRAGYWHVVPDRYASVRRLLSSILAGSPDRSEDHRTVLVSVIGQLATAESLVERALPANGNGLNVPRLNELISKQADKLNELLVSFRSEESLRSTGRGR
jgi:hypothetical protein